MVEPLSIRVDTFGTGQLSDERLTAIVEHLFKPLLRPRAIIEHFDLLKPRYESTAYHGHFGRADFPWERTDKVAELQAAAAAGSAK